MTSPVSRVHDKYCACCCRFSFSASVSVLFKIKLLPSVKSQVLFLPPFEPSEQCFFYFDFWSNTKNMLRVLLLLLNSYYYYYNKSICKCFLQRFNECFISFGRNQRSVDYGVIMLLKPSFDMLTTYCMLIFCLYCFIVIVSLTLTHIYNYFLIKKKTWKMFVFFVLYSVEM